MTEYQNFKAAGQMFTIESKYKLMKIMGHGAYGVVISAKDTMNGQEYAIKKCHKVFEYPEDAKRILREMKLMRAFDHPNVIRMVDLIPPPPGSSVFEDVYIVQDLMDTDLRRIIESPQSLSMDHIRYFVCQILRGLRYLHSANVIHRDLKPENILARHDCRLKICDFGLSKVHLEEEETHTQYVTTRWYRAPEIMLNVVNYSKSIDVWSVGCIFAELFTRRPILMGSDYRDQLQKTFDMFGTPTTPELEIITSVGAKRFVQGLTPKRPVPMEQLFPAYANEPQALDLLEKMLKPHHPSRISVDDGLAHPFISSLRDPMYERVADFEPYDTAFEHENLDKPRLQELMWGEMMSLRPSLAPMRFR
jgi:mitogen-activated protein kinase 1/3